MTVSVKNSSGHQISASVNQWGSDGDTRSFKISNGSTESWDRQDPRGFVLYLETPSVNGPYYVYAESEITVTTVNGKTVVKNGTIEIFTIGYL